MIKNTTSLVLIFSVFILGVKAQDTYEKSNPFDKWSFGFGLGVTQFYGDIMETENVKPAFSVQLNKIIKNMPSAGIDNQHSVQAEFIMGRMAGQNSFCSFCDNPHNSIEGIPARHLREGERFNTEFMEFDINFLINLSVLFDEIIEQRGNLEIGYRQEAKNRKLNFLAKVGVGLNIFRSLRQELETEQFINSYGYEWMWQNDFTNAGTRHVSWHANVKERTFVLGLITNYKISKQVAIDFSATSRTGGNDRWDAKFSNKADMFMFYSLGTTINLSKN